MNQQTIQPEAIKEYLSTEATRNRISGPLFTSMVRRAFGCQHAVLIGHHICFQRGSAIETENEIPSADSLIFDHQIMGSIFGRRALSIMQQLATLDCNRRDEKLAAIYYNLIGETQ